MSKTVKPPKDEKMTLYVPDVQRGTSVVGAAGSGKTFSVIDPLIRSALDQGFPTCIYDFKYPAQTERAVAYAMMRGYTVRVFAPGFPESETCNPLDLIRDAEDAIAAGQLAQVINKNFNRGGDKEINFLKKRVTALLKVSYSPQKLWERLKTQNTAT
jgi:type IV secretory pathway TraG/TraD family ATPase VirD4